MFPRLFSMMGLLQQPLILPQLLFLHHQTQKSGTVPFFKFFEFRQSSYFKSGDSPSRKIQQSAFASLGFL